VLEIIRKPSEEKAMLGYPFSWSVRPWNNDDAVHCCLQCSVLFSSVINCSYNQRVSGTKRTLIMGTVLFSWMKNLEILTLGVCTRRIWRRTHSLAKGKKKKKTGQKERKLQAVVRFWSHRPSTLWSTALADIFYL